MPTPIRITVIGAGSAQFSLGLVKDICLTPSLAGSEICFVDIDTDRLAMIHKLAERYANELGTQLTFSSTNDRLEALPDSDFVIHTAYVSGHHHARATRELTEKHGYYYGGVHLTGSHDDIKLMLDVARDMERLCPDAWLIMSGNPVFAGCTYLTRHTSIKVCGLCHGHYGVYEIARTIGLDPDKVTWEAPGLNHNIWLRHFLYEGKNAYPLLDAWIAEHGEEYWRTHVAQKTHDIQMSRGAVHQYQLYGLFPIGDTVRRGGWWYHDSLESKKYWFGEPWGGPDTELARPLFVKDLEARIKQMTELAHNPKASLIEAFGSERTREQQVGIIDGLANNNEGQFQVNIPNRGALPGIPDDVVVEVPAIVNAKGIQPIRVEPLPPKVMFAHVMPEWLQMERDLLAFHTHDRSLLFWNVLESPQTKTYQQAQAVFEDLMNMPGNESINDWYR